MISVILCTRNPQPLRLTRTLASLRSQDLSISEWELILVDNGSAPPLAPERLPPYPANLRIISVPDAGLTRARVAGIAAAVGKILIFVDDDNVLAHTYLRSALTAFQSIPGLAAAGGPVRPEFECPPPDWAIDSLALLALHDHGPAALMAEGGPGAPWPPFAPVGAGLCMRRTAAAAYADAIRTDPLRSALDRRAGSLASGGDNDMVFTALHAGGSVAYLPELALTHLIPAARLQADYLARLNRGIQRSWVRVLALHSQCPWPAIPRWTLPLRVTRAWWRTRAWRGPAEKIRFAGWHGRFEGQADLSP